MDTAALRYAILQSIERHEATNAGTYLDDKKIASELAVELGIVQRQLLILENHSLVTLAKAMGPSYGALLTPDAMEALEDSGTSTPPRQIGF